MTFLKIIAGTCLAGEDTGLNWKVGLMRGVEHVTNPEPRRKGVLRDSLFPPTHLGHMGR